MRVTLISAASPQYWPLMEIGAPNKLEYCIKHGVQFHMVTHSPAIESPHWGEREFFMIDALASYDTDWLWFMGADSLITNMNYDIRVLCEPEFDFIIGVDINGINNDSFLLRNNLSSKKFLQRVLSRRGIANDQHAMHLEMKTDLRTKLIPQRAFNSYKYDEYHYGEYPLGTWQEGDFVIQFPGMKLSRRIELMKEYSEKVKR